MAEKASKRQGTKSKRKKRVTLQPWLLQAFEEYWQERAKLDRLRKKKR
jgi:hypothetical protein